MKQFIAPSALDNNGLLRIRGKDARYLIQVLRMRAGDMLNVRTPEGLLRHMTVCNIEATGQTVILQVCGQDDTLVPNKMPSVDYWLLQCMARPAKMDIIVRQAAECGVHIVIPVISEYTQNCYTSWRGPRFERIIKEARQQSGSPVKTECMEPCTLKEAADLWCNRAGNNSDSVSFVLYERTTGTLSGMSNALKTSDIKGAALAVGSEGGFSPDEIMLLKERGFISVHFETNILRCETASLYGIAVLQNMISERQKWRCSELHY